MAAKTEFTIDAEGKSLGRVASQAAKTLMGKTSPDYVPNIRSDVKVLIVNAGKLSMPEKKRLGKKYTTYSGYPGGLKTERLGALNARKGHGEPLRRAIERMLPRNTLRVGRMKNLTITV
ncbi:hypothetical protein A3F27_00480 [Candidatus Kaiserbacteria bacterium RIFCSPHIGHO2_12_FULL_53_13]|uniref:50S ribosomal protein L13 n=1 Tax=Candidatus Kaiserbacteria bacterium RIFCSPHIGHO2_12_FULL_53_13 TaxID=1798502 RepID=A0A1F6E8T0_9BACT|nr:MAG: hypothetical protein A3F27_00480 [Candidatus Kaiserbacteria bacterium RIFCSPHIGHO2_12_FULL_53_13]OGG74437.1 MAG: hypothetical protein A3A37_02185 [Candidatus Kaiserbacteria bacterium RIFCSPLOWO2_01_FULL_52_36]